MGKINSGLLGPVSGKVGGIVGARWKDVSYIRSYVVPGASATDLQVAQRNAFKFLVAAARPFVGRIFNPYFDKFLKRESGFNRCISENIHNYDPGPAERLTDLQVTDGPLYPGSGIDAVEDGSTGVWTITWGVELGVDGSSTDVAIAWVRDNEKNTVAFAADGVRSDGTGGVTAGNSSFHGCPSMDFGVFFAKMNDALVSKISRNLVDWKAD